MDHVVYLDAKSNEFQKLLDGRKTTIIRGATGRKLPYGKVNKGDVLYFINNNAEGVVKAKAVVSSVNNSEKMNSEESNDLAAEFPDTVREWMGIMESAHEPNPLFKLYASELED